MDANLILAGVGGQGILTIAKAISAAALRRGMHVKQAEVHGMAQRGGAVQSHLRLSDKPIRSDLVPLGKADLILSVEPLETLRYVQYLKDDGSVIASTNAVVNMDNYPPIEGVLARIARLHHHVLVDTNHLARLAGSSRCANMVVLGAASLALEFSTEEFESIIAEMFASKGPNIVTMNQRAFRIGRNAATAYREAVLHGGATAAVREWLTTLTADQLADAKGISLEGFATHVPGDALSEAEAQAVTSLLSAVSTEGRRQLYEHEVYTLVSVVGAIEPPRYVFVPVGEALADEALGLFDGEKVVLKLVSPDVIHKSDAGAVRFVPKEIGAVRHEMDRMVDQHSATAKVAGVLVVEFVPREHPGFGDELFVGIRATREFGPVIAAGLGGVDTEYLAQQLRPGLAIAKAVVSETSAEQFLELFRHTAAYEVMTGQARGHKRLVSDAELLRCFSAFLNIARRTCVDRGNGDPLITELEVNPFAFRQQRLTPLDGRGRLGSAAEAPVARPLEKVDQLLEPKTIAVIGVSATNMNMGRIILNNIKDCGFAPDRMFVIKDQPEPIDGVRCIANLGSLPEPIDLLVVAAPAGQLPVIIDEAAASGKIASLILIPGGVGETEGSDAVQKQVQDAIIAARNRPDRGPVLLGPNCLGVQSRPGKYDTFFIPTAKLDMRRKAPARRVALVSQSGAFIITRLSNLQTLDPALTVSIGNQFDLTISDVLQVVAKRDDIDVIGVYVEGFNTLDGTAFLRAVDAATAAGKLVIFYKAGRTDSGRSAAAGHTASLAGDYEVAQAAAAQAGAIVCDTFKEFEQLLELATALHGKQVTGRRVGAISNAGFETVGMADAIRGTRYTLEMPTLDDATRGKLVDLLKKHKLDALVNPRNPLDLTPMANDAAYEDALRVMLDSPAVDAVVVSVVPLSPTMLTTADELSRPGSLAERLPRVFKHAGKPVIFVVDCGPGYDALCDAVRAGGLPVFRTCDQAIRSLGRYLCHRAPLTTSVSGVITTASRGDGKEAPLRPQPPETSSPTPQRV